VNLSFFYAFFLKGGENQEMNRLLTQKQKIILALKDAGADGMTNAELSRISLRYGGHLGHLYRAGYKIKKYNLDGGLYKYVLISEPSNIVYFKNANDEIYEEIIEQFDDAISSLELQNLLHQKHFHIVRKQGWYEQNI
jgi:hypothetical protein